MLILNNIFILLFMHSVVYAKDIFVHNKHVLTKSINQAKPGDSIILKNGTWHNIDIIFKAKGTLKLPITLRAEKKGQVIISGRSSLKILGEYLIVDGLTFKNGYPSKTQLIMFGTSKYLTSNSRLTNTTITDYNSKKQKDRYDWVVLRGGFHNRVDHCKFTKMKNKGVTLHIRLLDNAPANYHRIDHNEFSYRKRGNNNGYETIRIGSSKQSLQNSRTTVEKNIFLQCNGEGEIISNKSSENYYIHNTFLHSKGMLTLRHGNRCIIKNNFFFSNGHKKIGGIRLTGEGHQIINNYFENIGGTAYTAAISFMNGMNNPPLHEYSQVKDCNITHNKFIQTKYTIVSGANFKQGKYPIPPNNVLFDNNLFIQTKKPIPLYLGKVLPNIKFINNIIYKSKLSLKNLKGFQFLNPHLIYNSNNVYISNIPKNYSEDTLQPITQNDVGPQKEL